MSHIFISYSRKDLDIAEKIVSALAQNNLNTWIDWKSIPKGEEFINEIYRGIEGADVFLFLISPDSVESDWCNAEIKHAAENNKRIIPVSIRETKTDNIPPEIAKRNWIFSRDGKNEFDASITEILETISADYEWVKYHTTLQVKALEWKKRNKKGGLLSGAILREAQEQIVLSGQKDPKPTELQRLFVNESLKAETRTRNWILTIAGIIIATLAILSLYANNQRIDAENQKAAAIANEQEAQRQASISRAGELAALAQPLTDTDLRKSLLLGIESFLEYDTFQSRSVLLGNLNASPKLIKYLTNHTAVVSSIAFSPDGAILASGSWDNSIILWDVASGDPIGQPLTGHTDTITNITFSHDGRTLASVSCGQRNNSDSTFSFSSAFDPSFSIKYCVEGKIIFWDIDTQKQYAIIEDIPAITNITFSPNDKILAADGCKEPHPLACLSGEIILFDVESYQPTAVVSDMPRITTIAFNSNGESLAAGYADNTIILWDISTIFEQAKVYATDQNIAKMFLGHTSIVNSVAFSPDNKTLISGGSDGAIILWNPDTRKIKRFLPVGIPVNNIAISPDGKILASGVGNGSIILWDLQIFKKIEPLLIGHKGVTKSIAFSPDSKILASAGQDNTIILWDMEIHLQSGQQISGYDFSSKIIAISPDGKVIAAVGEDRKSIFFWNIKNHQQIGYPISGLSQDVHSIAFSPDGRTLAIGSCHMKDASDHCVQGEILLWNKGTLQLIEQPIIGHVSWVTSIAFSKDGKILASGSSDNTVLLWDITTHQQVGQLDTQNFSSIVSIAFSADGKTLATGSVIPTGINLWNTTTSQQIGQTLLGDSAVSTIAFSPDDQVLASGHQDGSTILWDLETYQVIGKPLTGSIDSIYSMVFIQDGKTLISASKDGNILWDIDPESWVERSCNIVARNFTRAEWKLYFPNEHYRKTCEQWDLEPNITTNPTVIP